MRSAARLLAATLWLIALPAQADIKITRWPDDVPCSAIKKRPDGVWTLTTAVHQGPITRKSGEMFAERRIIEYWDRKCVTRP